MKIFSKAKPARKLIQLRQFVGKLMQRPVANFVRGVARFREPHEIVGVFEYLARHLLRLRPLLGLLRLSQDGFRGGNGRVDLTQALVPAG